MTGVIYARYSSDNQREESIEGQIRENTAFAEKNGITIWHQFAKRIVWNCPSGVWHHGLPCIPPSFGLDSIQCNAVH